MAPRPKHQQLSVEEYIKGEESSEVRHEYIGGEVYAMVGTSDRHNLIAGNLFALLHAQLRGTPCRLFMSDMKVRLRVASDDAFYYPDLMLACNPDDRATYYRTQPCLIVEVLSETTERIDRREKLLAYTSIDSLQEYVLLSQNHIEVEVHRRVDGWRGQIVTTGDVHLQCLSLDVSLAAIYEDVPLS
ncbi:MAG: Uma2 family endonuclease [Gammaproteobacteria bacterium]|nr:Uma2 family endonuclease [Gammaproteobacteria bacterium]